MISWSNCVGLKAGRLLVILPHKRRPMVLHITVMLSMASFQSFYIEYIGTYRGSKIIDVKNISWMELNHENFSHENSIL